MLLLTQLSQTDKNLFFLRRLTPGGDGNILLPGPEVQIPQQVVAYSQASASEKTYN